MNQLSLSIVLLCVGLTAGYILYPAVNPQPSFEDSLQHQIVSTQHLDCELSSIQINDLVAKIAPAVSEQLITSGALGMHTNPQAVTQALTQQQNAAEKIKSEKEVAFAKAQEFIDAMIQSRSITQSGLYDAEQLLTQTGQEDKIYLLHARIAVAVNNGELTPKQAGLGVFDTQ